MNIAFDAFEAGIQPRTGLSHYVECLLDAILQTDKTNAYLVLYRHGHGVRTAGGQAQPLRCSLNRTVWSQVRLPLALATRDFDLLHVPGHRAPWLLRGKLVVTIHDLAFLKFPDTFKKLHRQRLTWFTCNAVRRADRIIAISESTKRDLGELLGVESARIDVVHHGVDHDSFRPDVVPATRAAPYILSVGTLQPRKNYVMLIRAFKKLCETWRDPLELLIAGQRGWLWEEAEREALKRPFAERVHFLGYVPDEELARLYRGASFVAMPSLYEGFGLPLLEAMACGAPVVAANASCFPEVLGDAAILLPPEDESAWADTMHELLLAPARRAALRERGLARARSFSWSQTAERTIAVYRRALQQ